jgi:hypothetical protein
MMHLSEVQIPTASASRYLQQIRRHWSHKFPVEFTLKSGFVPFSENRRCGTEHLKRFAFRDDRDDVRWTRL